jgi:hypothetical protein
MPKTDEELEAQADARLAKAVSILREDGLIKSVTAIKKHLNITDEPPVDPNAPPKPPKKDPPADPTDPPEGEPPPAKRRHWLYGDIDDE